MEALLIETRRDGYDLEGCIDERGETMTVGELIAVLENYSGDLPVFFSNDNGYTFGVIMEDCFEETYHC